jgi:hypothetical protein
LALTNVSSANAATYSVTVSNAFGSVVSGPAVVEVVVSAPFVTQQPASQTLAPGLTAVLKATALGNLPLRYQWQANGTNLNDAGISPEPQVIL